MNQGWQKMESGNFSQKRSCKKGQQNIIYIDFQWQKSALDCQQLLVGPKRGIYLKHTHI